MKKTNIIPTYIGDEPGIYIIRNKINNKMYVGSSITLRGRLLDHRSYLLKNKHTNTILQNSFNKHGIENFEFDVLEYHNKEYIRSMEQYWINMLNVCNRKYGYNIAPVAGSNLNLKRTKEQIKSTRDTQIKLGIIDNRTKYVFNLEGKLLFKSNILKDISNYTKCPNSNILKCLNGKRKRVNNYIISYNNKVNSYELSEREKVRRRGRIKYSHFGKVLNKKTGEIITFKSYKDFSDKLKCSKYVPYSLSKKKENKNYKLLELIKFYD